MHPRAITSMCPAAAGRAAERFLERPLDVLRLAMIRPGNVESELAQLTPECIHM